MDDSPNMGDINVNDDRIVSYYAIIMQVKRFQFVILYHYRLSIFKKEFNSRNFYMMKGVSLWMSGYNWNKN